MSDLGTLKATIERRRDDAAAVGATAAVASVLDVVLAELQELGPVPPTNGNGAEPMSDRMLRAPEVANRLGVARRTVYKNADGFPFTKRFPTGSVRFSERGLERWLERRR